MCVCDTGWIGRGDYTSYEGSNCVTYVLAIQILWIVVFMAASPVCIYAWASVITALGGCNRTMPSDTYANHCASGAVTGGKAPTAGAVQVVPAEPSGTTSPSSAGSGGATYSASCAAITYHRLYWLFASLPLRVSLVFSISTTFLLIHAYVKLASGSALAVIGRDVLPTVCSVLSILAFWGGTFDCINGFTKSNLALLRLTPADRGLLFCFVLLRSFTAQLFVFVFGA
jgi:hypothetical protein